MISVVTQRGTLVVGIAYGCPYYTGSAIFHLFFKVPQVKNRLFPTNPLPLCNHSSIVQFGQESCPPQKNSSKVSSSTRIKVHPPPPKKHSETPISELRY